MKDLIGVPIDRCLNWPVFQLVGFGVFRMMPCTIELWVKKFWWWEVLLTDINDWKFFCRIDWLNDLTMICDSVLEFADNNKYISHFWFHISHCIYFFQWVLLLWNVIAIEMLWCVKQFYVIFFWFLFHMPISFSSILISFSFILIPFSFILIFIVFVVHHNVKSIDTIEWATRVFILPLYLYSFALFVFMTWSIQRWRSKLNPILRNYPKFSPINRSAYKPETGLFNRICIRHSSF